MKEYKPLPRQELQEQPQRNKNHIVVGIMIGIFVGIVIFAIALENNISDRYYTKEICEELIINESIVASQIIAFEIINYTQSTGNILYFSENGTINEINIIDQCNLYNE
jgi:hypothetical protein